jgi:hypothetical protein
MGQVDCWGRGICSFEKKDDVLAPYFFSIAMENCRQDYYFTEKLIDCFMTNTVPIYWGCPSIGEVFLPEGMICFETKDELIDLLATLSESRYREMEDALLENKKRAFELKLTGHRALLERVADLLMKQRHPMVNEPASVSRASRSKGAAFLRKSRSGRTG